MRSGRVEATTPDLLEQMGYETRDITLPRIFFWIGVLFTFAFGAMAFVWGIYVVFIPNYAKLGQPSPIPLNRRLPPHPQIQVEPVRDMARFRAAEHNASNPEAIEQAMDTLANERGISGVRGSTVRGRGTSYPGSGNFGSVDGSMTGDTNVLESTHDPQVGENPLPGGVEKEPKQAVEVPAAGGGTIGAPGEPATSSESHSGGSPEPSATPTASLARPVAP